MSDQERIEGQEPEEELEPKSLRDAREYREQMEAELREEELAAPRPILQEVPPELIEEIRRRKATAPAPGEGATGNETTPPAAPLAERKDPLTLGQKAAIAALIAVPILLVTVLIIVFWRIGASEERIIVQMKNI